jgi:hypothetical protein
MVCAALGALYCPARVAGRPASRGPGIKRPFVKGRKVDPSAVPPTFGNAALWPTGRALGAMVRLRPLPPPATPADRCCPVSLALCAGAYWRALEARGLVRRLTGPFALVAAPASTNRWFSPPAPGGTRPDHSPYSYVARSLWGEAAGCQLRGAGWPPAWGGRRRGVAAGVGWPLAWSGRWRGGRRRGGRRRGGRRPASHGIAQYTWGWCYVTRGMLSGHGTTESPPWRPLREAGVAGLG